MHKIVGGDTSGLFLNERKVGVTSEHLIYHPWILLWRSEISARDRTLAGNPRNNSQEGEKKKQAVVMAALNYSRFSGGTLLVSNHPKSPKCSLIISLGLQLLFAYSY